MHSILLVDDEPLVRLALKTLVPWQQHGFACELEAGNGEQALHLLREHPEIDILLLDISMPVMSGLELLERLELFESRPEIVILSAYDDYPLVREAFKRGAADYLLKSDLEAGRVLELLQALGRRIEEKRTADSSPQELIRREGRYLKEDILRRLLRPGGVERFEEHRKILGLRIGARVRICLLWIEEFDTVARRYGESGDAAGMLQATVLNTIGQVLSKQRWGEAVSGSTEEYMLFLSFEEDEQADGRTEEILEEIRKALRHYANLEIRFSSSRVAALSPSLCELYEEAARGRTLPSRITVRARKYIHEHYSRPTLSLGELSTHLGVSPSHFCHQFAKETGQTFKEYLTNVRMEEARRLLIDTRLKVYEVAERVGYLNPEHFSRVFKRHTGLTPNTCSAAGKVR